MDRNKVLVLGATGPGGICVLKELLSRNVPALAFVRNPSKIPKDLADNALLEVGHGSPKCQNCLSSHCASYKGGHDQRRGLV